jgi:uncharacterized protein
MTRREKLLALQPNALTDKLKIIFENGEPMKLGEGGSGIIYKVKQLFSEDDDIFELRAIKFFTYRDDLVSKWGYVSNANFDTEIKNYTRLNHQNVLKVVDGGYYKVENMGVEIKIPYLVNEYFDLPDLESLFLPHNKSKCMAILKDEETIFSLFLQIIKGIQYLHRNEFYHCDIAPKNVLLKADKDGEFLAVIGDIGSGKSTSNATFRKMLVIGTREFMPKEIQLIKNTEISFDEFKKLQPYWDIGCTVKTLQKIIQNIKTSNLFNFDFWNLDRLYEKLGEHIYKNVDEVFADLEHLRPSSNQIFKLDELSEASRNIGQVIIPINSAFLSKRMRDISRHDIMLRLMDVTQLLGGATFFPGASHTRYEHSLGTYELMRKAMLALLRNNEYAKMLSEEVVIIGLLSALLSSIAYYPFSYIVGELQEQESNLYRILVPRDIFHRLMNMKSEITYKSLIDCISDLFSADKIAEGSLEYVIFGKSGNSIRELDVLNAILNSSVGVRVIDYLMRDSHHIGLTYEMNPNDLFMSMSIAKGEFCLKQSGITSAEEIISNRYWLFKRIYWNDPNRAYAAILKHLFFTTNQEEFALDLLNKLHAASNSDVLDLLLKHSGDHKESFEYSLKLIRQKGQVRYKSVLVLDKASSQPHSAFICRNFFKLDYSGQHRIRDLIEKEFIRTYKIDESQVNKGALILIDMPYEREGTKLGNDIRVQRYDNSYIELLKASGIVNGLNQSFQDQLMLVRVFIRPDIFYQFDNEESKIRLEEFFNDQLYNNL